MTPAIPSARRPTGRVVVAMPVRNEAATLAITLTSVLEAVAVLRRDIPGLDVKLVVCCNGCHDGSEELAGQLLDRSHPEFPAQVVSSDPGLLPALGRIVEEGGDADIFLFFDADILVMPDCALRMYRRLDEDPSLQVVYARARPLLQEHLQFKQRILCTPFRHRGVFAERHFFRGATYAIRAGRLRDPELAGLIPGVRGTRATIPPQRARPPVSDDALLSHTVVRRYGTSALHKEAGALIYVTPPLTVRDAFLGFRRRHHDQRALDAAFAAQRRWNHRTFRNRVDWSYVSRQPFLHRLELLAYLGARAALSAAGWLDAALAWRRLPSLASPVFTSLASTKRLDLTALPAALAATARIEADGSEASSSNME